MEVVVERDGKEVGIAYWPGAYDKADVGSWQRLKKHNSIDTREEQTDVC